MVSRHFIPTTVVSGFPGVGKSYISSKFPRAVRDLESSDFHWVKSDNPNEPWKLDENGNKIPQADWPNNYIESIKALDRSGMYMHIMVSSHKLIREEMCKLGIKYTNVFPENTPKMKKLIIDRYIARGSAPEFIESMDAHWDEYIAELENDTGSVRNLKLTPESLNVWTERMLMR